MKCTCPTQRPNARHPTQPIFHWKWGLRLLPNVKKSTHKKRNVHGQRKKLASPNARDTNMLVFLALGDAKVLSFALGDAKVPDARYFAFWWNIGLKPIFHCDAKYLASWVGVGQCTRRQNFALPNAKYTNMLV